MHRTRTMTDRIRVHSRNAGGTTSSDECVISAHGLRTGVIRERIQKKLQFFKAVSKNITMNCLAQVNVNFSAFAKQPDLPTEERDDVQTVLF